MHLEKTETPMSLAFELFYDQIRQAHALYQRHCFSCDFINRCSDRRQEEEVPGYEISVETEEDE